CSCPALVRADERIPFKLVQSAIFYMRDDRNLPFLVAMIFHPSRALPTPTSVACPERTTKAVTIVSSNTSNVSLSGSIKSRAAKSFLLLIKLYDLDKNIGQHSNSISSNEFCLIEAIDGAAGDELDRDTGFQRELLGGGFRDQVAPTTSPDADNEFVLGAARHL